MALQESRVKVLEPSRALPAQASVAWLESSYNMKTHPPVYTVSHATPCGLSACWEPGPVCPETFSPWHSSWTCALTSKGPLS